MNNFINDKFLPFSMKILNQRHLMAIRDGMIISMPLLIVGSIFVVIFQLPIDAYQNFMSGIFGEGFKNIVWNTMDPATTGIVTLVASFGVAQSFVKHQKVRGDISAGFISVSAYLVLTPPAEAGGWTGDTFGAVGMFLAMIVALVSGEIYCAILKRNIVIKMPDSVPPAVSDSFTSLIPAGVVLTTTFFVRQGLAMTTWETCQTIIYSIVQAPLTAVGSSLPGNIFASLLNGVFWIFGLHGQTIVGSIFNPLWKVAQLDNLAAFQAGATAMPNIITSQFMLCNVWIGGGGTTLPLVVYMFFFAKSKQVKQIANVAIVPSIFNINEPIIFGLPIVLNPVLAIPFILTPVVLTVFNYVVIDMGIFPAPVGIAVPWTCPMIFSGYLLTGAKISGAVLQIINFAIGFMIYMPFISKWDKLKQAEEHATEPQGAH